MTSSLIRVIGVLAVLCAAWIWLGRRLGPVSRSQHRLTALSLGHGALLVQARLDGRVFVLAVTRAGDVRLVDRRVEAPAAKADGPVVPFGPRSFAELVDRLWRRPRVGAAGGQAESGVDPPTSPARALGTVLRSGFLSPVSPVAPRSWRLRRAGDGRQGGEGTGGPPPPPTRGRGEAAADGP